MKSPRLCFLGLKKVKVVGGAVPLAKREAVTNGLGGVVFCGLNGVGDGFALSEVRGNSRSKGAAGSMRRGGLNEFALKYLKKPAVIQ